MSEAESQHLEYDEGEEPRTSARARRPPININCNDFGVNIPKFERKLDPEEFLDWLSIVERVFEYKDVPEDKRLSS